MANKKKPPAKKAEGKQNGNGQRKGGGKPPGKMAVLRKNVHDCEAIFKVALPKASNLTPERFGRTLITCIEKDPSGKLKECTMPSLMRAMIQAAEVGLEPGSALGHAYLIPYWNSQKAAYEAQFQVGTWGYVALAKRSEDVVDVWSDVVYSRDVYKVVGGTGDERKLIHEPKIWLEPGDGEGQRGVPIFAYAAAKLKDGTVSWRTVTEADCEKARARSQPGSKGKGPWGEWADEMRCKVAIKRARKYWPQVVELARAIEIEEEPDSMDPELKRAVAGVFDTEGEDVTNGKQGALDRAVADRKPVASDDVPMQGPGPQTSANDVTNSDEPPPDEPPPDHPPTYLDDGADREPGQEG
jgi:recombination protein RecT